ncbi:MAG: GldG family protein [Clostridia bacterium]|nr:GldG family protein [Clostridia bacterium]
MKNKLRINAAITIVAVLVCVVLLNLVVGIIAEKKPMKIDLTREGVYEFSEQTKEITKGLTSDIEVYALYPEDISNEYASYVREYLAKYQTLSDKFHVTYVDPYNDPTFVKKFEANGDSVDVGSVIVTCGDKFRVISFNELYSSNQYTNSVSIDMEKKMTAAIMNVTGTGSQIKVYFTEGHDEYSCSNLKSLFEGEGYTCEPLNLGMSEVPEDASILVIADPSKDFTAEEINAIDVYADKAGQIMLFMQPGKDIPAHLAEYISDWGVTIENDYIIESDPNHAYRSQYGGSVPAPIMQQHDITENLSAQKLNFMSPMTRSITVRDNNVYHAQHDVLLKTTESSWGETDLSASSASKDESDTTGPLNVAVMTTKYNSDNVASRLFVLGSLAAVETDGLLSQSSYANGDFLLNAASFMTESSDVLDIRAKQISDEALTMSQSQMILVKILLLYILPIVIFAAGIVVWWRRRYR